MKKSLVLASGSAQRRLVLESLGHEFRVHAADIDEKAIQAVSVSERVSLIATTKGQKVAPEYPDSLVLAGDSVIVLQDRVLEKPGNLEEAQSMLSSLSDSYFQELTAHWCIYPQGFDSDLVKQKAVEMQEKGLLVKHDTFAGRDVLSCLVAVIAKMRKLSVSEIEAYVRTQPVLTWAGAFSPAYHQGAVLIERIEGSFTGFGYGFAAEVVSQWVEVLDNVR